MEHTDTKSSCDSRQDESITSSKRFIPNLISNLANLCINILIGLWFTPYLVGHLGVAVYGLIPLTTTVTSYLNLLTVGLNAAVGRFLTISLEQKDIPQSNKIFNTSFWGSTLLAGVAFFIGIIASFNVDSIFNIPADCLVQARWLLLSTSVMFALTTVSTPLTVIPYTRNRLDIQNIQLIAASAVRVLCVVVLFNIFSAELWGVGTALVASSFVTLILATYTWRKLVPALTISVRSFDTVTLRRLTSTGGWVVLNQIGALLFVSIDLLVVNRMFGAESGGRYAAVLQWSFLLRSLSGALSGVFGPTICAIYARHDLVGLADYSRKAVKFTGLLLAVPIGMICGLSKPLLQLWLGPTFADLAPLMSLMTIHLSVNLCIMPLFNIQVVTNHVRIPGICTVVMGIANLGLAVLLAGPVGWGMYGIAAAGAIMLTFKNLIFTPLYAAHLLGMGYRTFYKETIPIAGATLVLSGVAWTLAHTGFITNWPRLLVAVLAISVVYLVFAVALLLTKDERATVNHLISTRTRS